MFILYGWIIYICFMRQDFCRGNCLNCTKMSPRGYLGMTVCSLVRGALKRWDVSFCSGCASRSVGSDITQQWNDELSLMHLEKEKQHCGVVIRMKQNCNDQCILRKRTQKIVLSNDPALQTVLIRNTIQDWVGIWNGNCKLRFTWCHAL